MSRSESLNGDFGPLIPFIICLFNIPFSFERGHQKINLAVLAEDFGKVLRLHAAQEACL